MVQRLLGWTGGKKMDPGQLNALVADLDQVRLLVCLFSSFL